MKEIIFPDHKCGLHLNHNEHKNSYEDIEEYILESTYDWQNEAEKERCIATDEIWTLQWYPDTPVGCYALAASTLESLLRYANEA